MRTTARSLALAILFIATSFAIAQEHPVLQTGFAADRIYDFGGIDSVDTFNGNLNIRIPLGNRYPVNSLNYGLTLVYNSKVWSYAEVPRRGGGFASRAEANYRSNAGLGWVVTMGRFVPPENPLSHDDRGGYQTPDGAVHQFFPSLHPPQPPFDSSATFTRDSSYLRRIGTAIDFPDGTTHHIAADGSLLQINDQFGNSVQVTTIKSDFAVQAAPCVGVFSLSSAWKITDSAERTHYVCFTDQPRYGKSIYDGQLVKRIVLQAPKNQSAVYTFHYTIPLQSNGTVGIRRGCHSTANSEDLSPDIPVLDKIDLPDGSSFVATYNADASPECDQGTLSSLTLPTGGRIEYAYRFFDVPSQQCSVNARWHAHSVGVATRRMFDGDSNPKWTYNTEYSTPPIGQVTCDNEGDGPIVVVNDPSEFFTTTVTVDGESTVRKYHYSVWPHQSVSPNGYHNAEFGLPFKRENPLDGAFLSTETEGLDGKRRTYVKYDLDGTFDTVECELTNSVCLNTNRRLSHEATLYEDGKSATTTHSGFDGFGHYRKTTTGGTFEFGNISSGLTNYNPGTDATGYKDGSFAFANNVPWILNTYDYQWTSENNLSAKTETCFNGNGFLTRKRTLRNTAGADGNVTTGSTDLLAVFTPETVTGNVLEEKYYGGDCLENTPCTQSIGGGAVCNVALPSTPLYELRHTYEHGFRKSTTRYDHGSALLFKSLDRDNDPAGAIECDRDSAGVKTCYKYDTSGRIKTVTPPTGIAETSYVYNIATANSKANVVVTRGDTSHEYVFDLLGRISREKMLMPDGSRSIRITKYDRAGRKSSVSDYEKLEGSEESFTPQAVTSTTYDAFDRPKQITAPDGSTTELTYTGAERTKRKSMVGSADGSQFPAYTTEQYDRQDRLAKVIEDDTTGGKQYETLYQYSLGKQLLKVTAGVQNRDFTYDGAGLLTREDHPESDATDYQYDARGHILSKKIAGEISLQFAYDAAEHLTAVTDVLHSQLLKSFVFDPNKGRLTQQSRRNFLTNGTDPDYTVTDALLYDDAGRVSEKSTTIAGPANHSATFKQEYKYTELNEPKFVIFPTCSGCGITALQEDRRLDLVYSAGLLTKIAGVTEETDRQNQPVVGLTYTPGGQPLQVRHANHVVDTYHPDDTHHMPRPARITFEHATECSLLLSQSPNVTVPEGNPAHFSVNTVDGATVTWYEGPCCEPVEPMNVTGKILDTPPLTQTTYYFARVTSGATCVQNSETFVATVCKPAAITGPLPFTGDPIAVAANAEMNLSVDVTGSDLTITWHEVTIAANGTRSERDLPAHGSSITVAAPPDGRAEYSVTVQAPPPCSSSAARLIRIVEVRSEACTIKVLSHFPPAIEVYPGRFIPVLSLAIEPKDPTTPGLETTGLYFQWYVNGTLVREGPSSTPDIDKFPASTSGTTITEKAWRVCATSNSAPVSFTTFVYDPRNCPQPPQIGVERLPYPGDPDRVILHATNVWWGMTFQWYRGDSGNTHFPLDPGSDMTVMSTVGAYWVRGKSVCGTTIDSPTIVLSIPSCSPVQFTRHPDSAQVAAKQPYTLYSDATGIPSPTQYTWNRIPDGGMSEVDPDSPNSRTFTPKPAKTTTYWVHASNGCSSAGSKLATLHVVSCEDIHISQAPQTASINQGFSANLNVTADSPTGKSLTYQWYVGESGDTSGKIVGAESPTQTFMPSQTTNYWVRVKASTCEIDLPTTTVYVCRQPYAPQANAYFESYYPGQSHWLDASGTGDNLQYQWYIGAKGDTSNPYRDVRSIQVAPGVTTKYWFRVTSDCFGATPDKYTDSGEYQVTVCPSIRVQPVAQYPEVMPNTRATLTIEADRADKIDWFQGTANGGSVAVTMIPVSANPATGVYVFQTPPITGPATFWANVTSGTCIKTSESVSVNTCQKPTVAWGYGLRTQVAAGENQDLSLTGSISGVYEQMHTWYVGNVGDVAGSTVIDSGQNVVQHAIHPTITTKYWVRLQEASGCYADTTQLVVSVCIPTITAQPQSVMIDKITNPSATAALTVGATGEGIEYQWFIGQPGDYSTPVGPKSSLPGITVSPSNDTTYWVYVTGCQSPKSSNAATVSLCRSPFINGPPGGKTSTAGANVTLTVGAIGTDLTYQWYVGTTGVTTNPIAGATAASVTVAPATTTDYWVRISGRCGASADSVTAKVSIPPTITTQPASSYVMPGTTRTLTVAATGSQLSYQWYSGTSTLIAGATGTSYTTPAINGDTSYFVTVTSGVASVDSTPAVLTVCTKPTVAWGYGLKTQVAQGEPQTLSITGSSSGVYPTSHFWYVGNSGDVAGSTFVNGGGPSDVQYAIAPTVTTKYWVRTRESNGCYADTTTLTVTVCVPTITTQPQSVLINQGGNTLLTSAANGGALTYQWYTGDSGVTTNPLAGATSPSYTAAPAATTKYWVRVTGSCGIYRDSNTATVTICQPPQIAQHPLSFTANANTSVALAVYASGTNLTYQWYYGTSGNTASPVNGGTASSINVSQSVTTDYWVKVSGSCGSVNSNTGKVSIAPAITTQPAGGAVTKGSTRTLSVAASGTQLSYQWYSGTNTQISGATAASYATPPINADITYWARVFSGNAPADSAQAVFTVCQPRNALIVTNPGTSGAAVTLSVDTVGNESYDWYRGESGDTSSFVGSGYQVTVFPAGTTKYWVRTHMPSCDADSAAITVRICAPSITAQPQSAVIVSGTTKTLSVSAAGTAPITYQWYVGNSGVTTNPIAGATASTYTTPALTSTTTYWVQVKSPADAGCSTTSANSAAATVTVCQAPAITQHPLSATLTYNTQSATLTVYATGNGLTYQWYEGASGDTTKPVNGGTSSSVSVTPGTTKSYWVRVNGTCGSINSNAALLSVMPTIYSQPPNSMTVCQNSTNTFTVSAGGNPLSYTWYGSTNGGAYTTLGTTASITIPVPANMDLYCAVTSGNATKTTWPTSVSVTPGPPVNGISKMAMSATMYKLTAWVIVDYPMAMNYSWYRGPLGNTSNLISGGMDAYVTIPPSTPVWVRVTDPDTQCWTDAATTVP